MSDGMTLCCPSCGKSALHKEYDFWKVKVWNKKIGWYDYQVPVYTCNKCFLKFAIERVVK